MGEKIIHLVVRGDSTRQGKVFVTGQFARFLDGIAIVCIL